MPRTDKKWHTMTHPTMETSDPIYIYFFGGGGRGVSDPLWLSSSLSLNFFDYFFLSTTLLTRMTGISFHMQWPLTSQSNGSFLKENNWFFITDKFPRPGP
jgi:hypothetical protein